MADNKHKDDEVKEQNQPQRNDEQHVDPRSGKGEPNDIGQENNDLSDEELQRQEDWREHPESRRYVGPKTVDVEEMNDQ